MRNSGGGENLELVTKTLFNMYCQGSAVLSEDFEGLSVEDLPRVENIFQTSINIYQLSNESDFGHAELVYRAKSNYKERLNLNLYKNHFSWIRDLRMYTKSYKCSYCSKLFKSSGMVNQHTSSCTSKSRFVYPNGPYSTAKSIFSKLDEVGITTPKEHQFHPYFCVFDCEAYFDLEDVPRRSMSTVWEAKHKLASVSISSNVPGYTDPHCFVNDYDDEHTTVVQMMNYLTEISEVSQGLLCDRYENVFTQLEFMKEEAMFAESKALNGRPDKVEQQYNRLADELDGYISEILCFGFNSAKYDIPLIKPFLVKYLLEKNKDIDYVIKKGNNYMCLKANNIKFVDVTNFLAAGAKYDEYLAAMGVKQRKFFWPYEKFTSLALLKQTHFPSHTDFYSKLTNSNISQEDYNYCKNVWEAEGMETLRDLLVYYNNHDVIGFVEALTIQRKFFIERDLDFKSAISIPGLAIQYLFKVKDQDSPIFLYGDRHKDLYHLVRENIRGGLSMVFSRYQKIGSTKIKPDYFGDAAKVTKGAVGVDFSGMNKTYSVNLQKFCDLMIKLFRYFFTLF
jgi:hypothetical protein